MTDDRPTSRPIYTFWKISNGHNSAARHLIHFAFGSRVGFSVIVDQTATFLVGSNPRLWLATMPKKIQMVISRKRIIRFTYTWIILFPPTL